MAEDAEEKLVGLNMFPKVPEYERDVASKQSLWVRYGGQARSTMTREGWTLEKSNQQHAEDRGFSRLKSPQASGPLEIPERLTLQVSDAPGSFALPLKVKKQIKPNFRVSMGIAFPASEGAKIRVTVKAFLISEYDRLDLPNWHEPNQDEPEPLVLGNTSVTHLFESEPERGDEGYGVGMGFGNSIIATHGPSGNRLKFMQQVFEFSSLKVTKPSRMRKVYMLFACTLMNRDTIFVAYHVPTIVIAHITNQGARALNLLLGNNEKLGGDAVGDDGDADSGRNDTPQHSQQRPAVHDVTSGAALYNPAHRLPMPLDAPGASSAAVPGGVFLPPGGVDAFNMSGMYPDQAEGDRSSAFHPAQGFRSSNQAPQTDAPIFLTREAVRDFLIQEYEAAGLTRPLTEMDMRTAEAQAGFQEQWDAARRPKQITQEQFQQFRTWYGKLVTLLGRIRTIWNKTDPTVLTGFDVGRLEAFRALKFHPPGTFLIRPSMSAPGSVVISLRQDTDNTSNIGVIHVLIGEDDMDMRRMETWVRDFQEATMLLDIYSGRCVSKHEIFIADYVRVQVADEYEELDPTIPVGHMDAPRQQNPGFAAYG